MRRYLCLSLMLCSATPALANDAGDLAIWLDPTCAKPVASLSVPQLEQCKAVLDMMQHFTRAVGEAQAAQERPAGTVTIYRGSRVGRQ